MSRQPWRWSTKTGLQFCNLKTKFMISSRQQNLPSIHLTLNNTYFLQISRYLALHLSKFKLLENKNLKANTKTLLILYYITAQWAKIPTTTRNYSNYRIKISNWCIHYKPSTTPIITQLRTFIPHPFKNPIHYHQNLTLTKSSTQAVLITTLNLFRLYCHARHSTLHIVTDYTC